MARRKPSELHTPVSSYQVTHHQCWHSSCMIADVAHLLVLTSSRREGADLKSGEIPHPGPIMGQPAVTFVMDNAGVQPLTVWPDAYGMDFLPNAVTPLAQGTFGAVYKVYKLIQGRFRPCIIKQIPLSVGGVHPIQEEYARLCSVYGIAGAITVVQGPVYTATHGYLVTEYVSFAQKSSKHLERQPPCLLLTVCLQVHSW